MVYPLPEIRTGLIAVCSIILVSCASSSDEIATSYVSPTQFSSYSCNQLSQELARLNRKKSELAGMLDKAASNDETITAVSLILFWPAAFALGGNDAQEAEYARLKGEYDAVLQTGVEKNCKLDPNKIQTPRIAVQTIPTNSKSAINYYGEAEDEVNAGNYDGNLWSKAYVMVEGDESKRKAKYIELRANQLYMENVGSTSTSSLDEPYAASLGSVQVNFSGTYDSNITGNLKRFFKSKDTKLQLAQNGKKITGTFGKGGSIWGKLDDDTIKFDWAIRNGSGRGEWIMNKESKEIRGKWSETYYGDGDWNITKLE